MARSLNSQQISMLKSAFFTPAQINAYESGQPNPAADRVIANGGSFLGNPAAAQAASNAAPAFSGGFTQSNRTGPSRPTSGMGTGVQYGDSNYLAANPRPVGRPGGNVAPSGMGTGVLYGSDAYLKMNPPPKSLGQPSDYLASINPPDPMSSYPSYPSGGGSGYTVPTITPKDFTQEAMALASKAFQPVQDMLDQSKTNVGQQGDRSRQIVGGLYDNLVKDIASKAAEQSAQYDQQKATTQSNGAALATQIGQNYSSGANQTADLLQKIGGQAAAPQALSQSANDQAWQQGQANTHTADEAAYFGKQQQGQADYNTQLGNIEQTQGVNSQKDILNQVGQMLAGIDAQKAQTSANTSTTGLDLANKLSTQDLSAQQANAGFQQTSNQNAQTAALDQYKAQTDKWSAGQAAQAAAAASQRQAALDQAQITQQGFDNQLKTGQYKLDIAKANAASQGSTSSVPIAGKNLPESRAAYASQDPKDGGALFDAIVNLAQDPTYAKATGANSVGTFMAAARKLATDNQKNGDQAATMAADIYNQLHGTG